MRNNALYFPYIDVPRSQWLFQMALYWDKVLAIVPYGFLDHPEDLSPSMRQLVQEGLVEQLSPGYYYNEMLHAREPFLQYVESRLRRHAVPPHIDACARRLRIHMEKVEFIARDLEQLGLIRLSEEHSWYDAVPWVAVTFMAYLASCLGGLRAVNAWPVTDDPSSIRALGGVRSLPFSWNRRPEQSVRRLVLSQILPAPADDLAPATLIRFKSRHQAQLRAFRDRIESLCTRLATIPSAQARAVQAEVEGRRLGEEASALAEAMRGVWRRVIFRDVLPVVAGATAVAADPHNPLAVTSGVTALANAVYQFIGGQREQRERASHPLAYGTLAQLRWARRPESGGGFRTAPN